MAEVLLSAVNLTKRYGENEVVRGVSIEIHAGEILGFLGPNGAGKTTTVGMLYGRVLPTTGDITFCGLKIPQQAKQARAMMGIVTQDDNLDPDFNVEQNLAQFATYYGMPRREIGARVEELIETVNLHEHRKHRIDELSGGLKRRLVLARSLINRPKLVFLDEPTTGLDPDARQDFWKLVLDLRTMGCGVVLTTHYMDEAQRLSDRLILLQKGLSIDEGTPTELIGRTVGKEMIEVEGLDEAWLAEFVARHNTWWRPFGAGATVAVPDGARAACIAEMDAAPWSRFAVRPANLEDVFLKLTGADLTRGDG